MTKTCKVCGRECSIEALQCASCRASEFHGQPSRVESYKAKQHDHAKSAKLRAIELQIDDLSSYPLNWERPLVFVAVACGILYLVLPQGIANIVLAAGGLSLGASVWLSRTNDTVKRLLNKARDLRES